MFCATVCFGEQLEGRVVGISDGDTISIITPEFVQYKVRLAGIDAPEKRQPFGQVSKQNLSQLIYDKVVVVDWEKQDRYQRLVGKILLDGEDVNLEQIKAGLAWHYRKYKKEQVFEDRLNYLQAEEKARVDKLGLWQDAEPVPPWEWRKSR
jgi:endonuclease YncB( thermonuclease family)